MKDVSRKLGFWLLYHPLCCGQSVDDTGARIHDHELFLEICDLLGKPIMRELSDPQKPGRVFLEGEEESKAMIEALKRLKSAGLEPRRALKVRPDLLESVIPISSYSARSKIHLDDCEFLCLVSCEARVGCHYTTQRDKIVAMADKSEFRKTADIGDLAPGRQLAISKEFIERFQAAGLGGAVFLPLEWCSYAGRSDVLDEPIRTHWLSAVKEMPRCLTPRVGFSGDLAGVHFWDNEELLKHAVPHMQCGWDDGGRTDFTLRFRRKEVEALGDFDVARTWEWIHLVGNENPRWFPQLIVSQRFRQWARKQRYKLHYGLCELVD